MKRILITFLLTLLTLGGLTALNPTPASAAPGFVDSDVPAGTVIDKADGAVVISGTANADTARVLVAIRNNANSRWWHPGTCSANVSECGAGTLEKSWKRSPAIMSNSGGARTYRFPADLPPGNYNLGLKAVGADGTVAPGGGWWQFTVENSQPLSIAGGTPSSNATVNEGLVTITSSHPFGSPIDSAPGSARIALKDLNNNTWYQGNGAFGPNYKLMSTSMAGYGAYSFNARLKADLAPGRYGYWVEHYDTEDVKYSGGWHTFNVRSCANRCANVSVDPRVSSYSASQDGGFCWSASATTYRDGGNIKFSLRNNDTGRWLNATGVFNSFINPENPTFGNYQLLDSNLGQILQSDPGGGNSCFSEVGIELPVGSYSMGINPFDTSGARGIGHWISFDVNP